MPDPRNEFMMPAQEPSMTPVAIEYGTTESPDAPAGLPPHNEGSPLLLYGRDGEFAMGPVLGFWDDDDQQWLDQNADALDWLPTYYAVPAPHPERSYEAPTIGGEVA